MSYTIDPAVMLPDEPLRIADRDIDRLMVHCARLNASDITFQTNQPVWAEIYGRLKPVTRRLLTPAELIDVLNKIYGANGAAQIASGKDIDLAYEIRPDRISRYRFRINATGIMSEGSDGIQITARAMPEDPPELLKMGVEQEIIDECMPRHGLVLITGPTGSGKSTLLAGIIRYMAENPEAHKKILTYEAPIEFVYDRVTGASTIISQTEVPRHLPNFAAGVRNAMRRKPTIILVGEARDPETMGAAAEASLTGHTVYSTVHANGVAETVRRMVSVFPAEERQARAIDLMESLRLVVTQILLRTVDGKRVACREYLTFSDEVRDEILSLSTDDWPNATRRLTRERGQTMLMAAQRVFDEGKIDQRTFNVIAARAKADEAAAAAGH